MTVLPASGLLFRMESDEVWAVREGGRVLLKFEGPSYSYAIRPTAFLLQQVTEKVNRITLGDLAVQRAEVGALGWQLLTLGRLRE